MLLCTRSTELLVTAAAMSVASASPQCDILPASGDGVPAAYYQAECKGKAALQARDYKAAESFFRQALSETIFEAPNYELKAELGLSLCRQAKKAEGRRELREFVCMAEAELGKR